MPSLVKIETFDMLDEKVCSWIERMWKQGEPLLTIGDALSALHFFQPSTKRQIPHAWKLFATWRKLEVPARAPPLTAVLVRGMSALALDRGQLELATCLILGFHALLRTGELLSLRGTDFLMGKTHALLRLELTKTGRRHAVSEAISLDDEIVLLLLTTLLQVRKDKRCLEALLWNQSSQSFRQQFKKLCHDFGLDHLQFRPYSLRRGGATDFFQRTLSMEATLIRGRWESSRAAKLYINDGLSFLPTLKTPQLWPGCWPNITLSALLRAKLCGAVEGNRKNEWNFISTMRFRFLPWNRQLASKPNVWSFNSPVGDLCFLNWWSKTLRVKATVSAAKKGETANTS